MYDITNQASWQDLEDWHALVVKSFEGKELPMMVLMGNKSDLAHMQAVKTEQHQSFAQKNGMHSQHYVSAKSGDQIPQTFFKIAADLAGVKLTKPMIEAVA